jgi:signal transduction histidine kinase
MCVQTLSTGVPFVTQYLIESTGRWLELSVSKMDEDHLIHIFTDVTPIKESQLQLERTVQELKRSNTHLEDFAHAASHDMKEPLRKIRTFTDRLKSSLGNRINEQEVMMMQRIETSAERMQHLVEDLLEFSHVSERPQEMDPLDLNEKIKQILIDLELPIEEKNAVVHVSALPSILGHRRQIQQLFHNLISNALKYSKPDIAPEIFIESRIVKGTDVDIHLSPDLLPQRFHLIEVKDNGIGFEQEYAEKIFEIFQRLHGKAEYSGTGVGLSIARKVVENHNGYIWAKSEVGIGTTFSVLLPI